MLVLLVKEPHLKNHVPGPTEEWALDELRWYLKGVGEKGKIVRPHPTFWSLIS